MFKRRKWVDYLILACIVSVPLILMYGNLVLHWGENK